MAEVSNTNGDPRLLKIEEIDDEQQDDFPKFLIGDNIRLKQILINLTKNAMKFTSNGNIEIVASYNEADEKLKIKVSDTGSGISKKDFDKLFKMFSKLEDTDGKNTEGVGIGLVICQSIVEQSGGEIKVFSDGLNMGSTFAFTMVMKKASQLYEQELPFELMNFNSSTKKDKEDIEE